MPPDECPALNVDGGSLTTSSSRLQTVAAPHAKTSGFSISHLFGFKLSPSCSKTGGVEDHGRTSRHRRHAGAHPVSLHAHTRLRSLC